MNYQLNSKIVSFISKKVKLEKKNLYAEFAFVVESAVLI